MNPTLKFNIPPTGQHLELVPSAYPQILRVAIRSDNHVYSDPSITTHIEVALKYNLDLDKSISGYITITGQFVKRS